MNSTRQKSIRFLFFVLISIINTPLSCSKHNFETTTNNQNIIFSEIKKDDLRDCNTKGAIVIAGNHCTLIIYPKTDFYKNCLNHIKALSKGLFIRKFHLQYEDLVLCDQMLKDLTFVSSRKLSKYLRSQSKRVLIQMSYIAHELDIASYKRALVCVFCKKIKTLKQFADKTGDELSFYDLLLLPEEMRLKILYQIEILKIEECSEVLKVMFNQELEPEMSAWMSQD